MKNSKATPINILLVEDNPNDVLLTTKLLRHAKLLNNLDVAKDGEEALAYLLRKGIYSAKPRPDLILLDLNLPKKDGWALLADIRNIPELNDITVAVQSASADGPEILRTGGLQADCYVTKPIDLGQMIDIVKSVGSFGLYIVKQ